MINLWEHARIISAELAVSVAMVEGRCSSSLQNLDVAQTKEQMAHAIEKTWQMVIEWVEQGRFDLSVASLSQIHMHLASLAEAKSPGQFRDKGEILGIEWSTTMSQLLSLSEGFDYSYLTDAVILAQLRWGGHVQSMAFSLGWLCLNGMHLQHGMWAIYPPPDNHDCLLKYLSFAGPDCWDTESLRALFGKFTNSQWFQ